MENASKALLMAAGVLMGILVLSLAVFLFADFGSTSSQIRSDITSNQLTQFNTQFTIYAGRDDITIYDIITVANLAKENNDIHNGEAEFQVQVNVSFDYLNMTNFQNKTEKEKSDVINKHNTVVKDEDYGSIVIKDKFKCSDITYHENGRVATITFKKNNT